MNNTDINEKYKLMNMLTSFWVPQIIYTAVKFSILDIIQEHKSIGLKKLLSISGIKYKIGYRLIRALIFLDIVTYDNNEIDSSFRKLKLTTMGLLLTAKEIESLRDYVILVGEEFYTSWSKLYDIINNKENFSDKHFYECRNRRDNILLNNAISSLSQVFFTKLVNFLKLNKADKVLDLGGGDGSFAIKILEYVNCKIDVLDRKQLLHSFKKLNNKSNFIRFIGGDFFVKIPKGYDIILLIRVLHNWSDKNVLKILLNISKQMEKETRLYIVDSIIDNDNDFRSLMDINMLVLTGGSIRTIREYTALIRKSNLKFISFKNLDRVYSIIELARNN